MKLRNVFNGIVIFLLLAPIVVVVVVSVNPTNFLAFPPRGFSLRWYSEALAYPPFLSSLVYSVKVAVITVLVGLAICLPTALYLTRSPRSWLTGVTRAFSLGPLTVPEILVALGILISVTQLYSFGTGLWSVVLGHVVFCVPYGAQVIGAGLANIGAIREDAARTLGASPMKAFFLVTVREMVPSTLGAAAFIFIFSFDNVNISIFLTSPGEVTLPVQMYQYLAYRADPTVAAMSTVLIGIGLLALFAVTAGGALNRQFGLKPVATGAGKSSRQSRRHRATT